jgi:hypothetical protein
MKNKRQPNHCHLLPVAPMGVSFTRKVMRFYVFRLLKKVENLINNIFMSSYVLLVFC